MQFEYVGFWKRVLALLVDAVVGFAMLPVDIRMSLFCYEHRTLVPAVLVTALGIAFFDVFLVVKFGGTPGKLLLGMRVVNGRGQFVSVTAALMRHSWGLVLIVLNWLLAAHVFSALPISANPQDYSELKRVATAYGGIWYWIRHAWLFVFYVDVLVILMNEKKRALRDFIAGSYVITRKSHLALIAGDST